MYFFFDYIYFRIAQWKFKSQGPLSPTAIGFLSVMQAFIIELLITPLFDYLLKRKVLNLEVKDVSFIAGALFIILYIPNSWKYKGKYERYLKKWGNEGPKKRLVKGGFVILSLVLPIILFGVLYKHSY